MDDEYRWLLYEKILYLNQNNDEIKSEEIKHDKIFAEFRISLSLLLSEFYKLENEFLKYSKQTDLQKGKLFENAKEFVKIIKENIFKNLTQLWSTCLIIKINNDLRKIRIENVNKIENILTSYNKKLEMYSNQCKAKGEIIIFREGIILGQLLSLSGLKMNISKSVQELGLDSKKVHIATRQEFD
uniref:Uncharacterized protein n=1 Tax=Meloidogyne hapla TaxID=6305 RepID=A0A1I8B8J3_MELHA